MHNGWTVKSGHTGLINSNFPNKWQHIQSFWLFPFILIEAHLNVRLKKRETCIIACTFCLLSFCICLLLFFFFTCLACSIAFHSLHRSHCWSSMPCFWSRSRRRRRWWRGKEGGGPSCASVSQTCSSNGLYYLLLFAVCCNQAPEWGWSRNRQRFFSSPLPCDGNGLKWDDNCKAAGRKQVDWSCCFSWLFHITESFLNYGKNNWVDHFSSTGLLCFQHQGESV